MPPVWLKSPDGAGGPESARDCATATQRGWAQVLEFRLATSVTCALVMGEVGHPAHPLVFRIRVCLHTGVTLMGPVYGALVLCVQP